MSMITLFCLRYSTHAIITLITICIRVEYFSNFLTDKRSISGPNPNEIMSIPASIEKIALPLMVNDQFL